MGILWNDINVVSVTMKFCGFFNCEHFLALLSI